MSYTIVDKPGLWTSLEDPTGEAQASWEQLRAYGYEWVSFQVQNGGNVVAFDLSRPRAAGLYAGAWGVTYDARDFAYDGQLLGLQAVRLGAQHVTMNVEFAAKATRPNGMRPIIDGIRVGGWHGPVNLITLGAPSTPTYNDFAMDTDSFLATGGGVIAEAYSVETRDYDPVHCKTYWTRFVPSERINYCIGLYTLNGVRFNGAQNRDLLVAAGVNRAHSVYMIQHGRTPDWEDLDDLAKTPPPVDYYTAAEAREDQKKVYEAFRLGRDPDPKLNYSLTRSELAGRIVAAGNTDKYWINNRAREAVKKALDDAGVP